MKQDEGYILASVLIIGTVISTLIFTILIIFFMQNRLVIKKINKKKLDLACISAANIELARLSENNRLSEEITSDSINVILDKTYRGLYLNLSVKAVGHNDSSMAVYTIGRSADIGYFRNALTISRPDFRGVVAGATKIVGDAVFTGDRISLGNIPGIGSTNRDYLSGEITVDKDIPVKSLAEDLMKSLFNPVKEKNTKVVNGKTSLSGLFTDYPPENDILVKGDLVLEGMNIASDVSDYTTITVQGNVKIEKETYSNYPMVIHTQNSVLIAEGCKLENIVLVSYDDIRFGNGSLLTNCQIFSADSITISDTRFNYPSVIGLYADTKDESKLKGTIDISGSRINGTVVLVCSETGLNTNKAKIKIDSESSVQGIVYSENNLELYGTVTGSVYSYNLTYIKAPTEYINWFADLHLDRTKLDENYLLPSAFESAGKYRIMKESWIY